MEQIFYNKKPTLCIGGVSLKKKKKYTFHHVQQRCMYNRDMATHSVRHTLIFKNCHREKMGVSQLILSRFIFFHIVPIHTLSQLILASDFTKKYEGDLGLGEAIILKSKKGVIFGRGSMSWDSMNRCTQYLL